MPVNQSTKTAALTVFLLLSAVGLPSRAQDALWRSYFSSAEHSYQHGDYAQAEKLLQSLQPNQQGVWMIRSPRFTILGESMKS